MRRRWLAALLLLGLSCVAKAEPLRVGLTGKYPPFNYYDTQGRLTGFDVDVARHICTELARDCEFVVLQWDGILAALLADKIDVVIGSMAITPERRKMALFSRPYYESGAQVFAHDPAFNPKAPGAVIGVTLGTTYETALRERFPQAEVRTYKGDTEALQDVLTRRLDAVVTDRLVGAYLIRASGAGLHAVGDPLFLEEMGIPAKPERKELVGKINAAIQGLRESPRYKELAERHFGIAIHAQAPAFSWKNAASLLLRGFGATVVLSFAGLALGFLLAIALVFVSESFPAGVGTLVRIGTDFVRATPFLVQLFAVYFGLPTLGIALSAFEAAVLTMAVHSSAYLAEVFLAGYRAVPLGQWRASYLLGLSGWQTLRLVVFPQMVPLILPPGLNTVVAMIKDSAIVSVISVYELTMQTQQLISSSYRPFELYLAAAAFYAVINYPLILLGRRWASRAEKAREEHGG